MVNFGVLLTRVLSLPVIDGFLPFTKSRAITPPEVHSNRTIHLHYLFRVSLSMLLCFSSVSL